MNKKAMLELADHMERVPRRAFDMDSFSNRRDIRHAIAATVANRCGTTCCIAGEKVLLDGGSVKYAKGSYLEEFFDSKGKPVYEPDNYAGKRLGLDSAQAEELFYNFTLKTPKQAAARIREMVGAK